MMRCRTALTALNRQLSVRAQQFRVPRVSNWDVAVIVILLSTWSVVARVGGLIGLAPVFFLVGSATLLSLAGFLQWYSCPALRALGWSAPHRRFIGVAIIAGLLTAAAISLTVRAAGVRIAGEQVFMVGLVVTVAPILEESFFRGFLQPSIAVIAGTVPALIATTLCFAAIHEPVTMLQFACLTVNGLSYGLLRLRSGSIAAPVVMHATYNLALLSLR
jgi:membrane protease YdiL (CAAX protease family)